MAVLGYGGGAICLICLIFDQFLRQRLRVGPGGVWVGWWSPWFEIKGRFMPAAAVDHVHIPREPGKYGQGLEIIGSGLPINFGAYLSDEELEFARNVVLAGLSGTQLRGQPKGP